MKVIFFNSCKQWGGGEKWHLEMGMAINSNEFQVEYFANPNSKLYTEVERRGVVLNKVEISSLSFFNPFLIFRLVKHFKNSKADAIVLNLPSDVKTAGIAAKLAGIKNIVYRRGSAIPVKNSFSNRFLFSKIINNILVNSNITKETVLAKNPHLFNVDKIKVIHNGIDVESFTKKETEPYYKRESNEIVLGNLARLSQQKGQKYLLNLAKKLKQAEVKFKLLIGGAGELEKELQQAAFNMDVLDSVTFTGFVNDAKSFLNSIDIFVFPSIWEGFGFSIIEAKVMQKPVVAFNVSSNVEVINKDVDGFLIEPFNEQAFFEKVMALINDEKLRKIMGAAGRNDVLARFEKNKVVEELKDYLRSLI